MKTAKRANRSTSRAKRRPSKSRRPRRKGTVLSFSARAPELSMPSTYEEALLESIIGTEKSGGDYVEVNDIAAAFSNLLSNATPGLSEMHFKHGAYIGKMLYRLYIGKDDRYRMNPMLGLLDFFDKAGYKRSLYRNIDRGFNIIIYDGNRIDLGFRAHTFEAGVISGYVSAVEKKSVRISEVHCKSEGSQHCSFVPDDISISWKERPNLNISLATSRLADGIINCIRSGEELKGISAYYYTLLLEGLLHRDYTEQINNMVYYCGSEISDAFIKRSKDLPDRERMGAKELEKAISLLYLGELKVKSESPFNATIRFNRLLSKQEFVDMSLSFIKGFTDRQNFPNEIIAEEERKDGEYIIRIKEVKAKALARLKA